MGTDNNMTIPFNEIWIDNTILIGGGTMIIYDAPTGDGYNFVVI